MIKDVKERMDNSTVHAMVLEKGTPRVTGTEATYQKLTLTDSEVIVEI